ncbi:hypothetical protein RIF29_17353 [Crotalaria pallida]|uniref:H(+)-exporting diphosphatase n=1 Tax=Crotalaria pallida TaxID=3830 RepID=A0AAN9IEF9_CROPI
MLNGLSKVKYLSETKTEAATIDVSSHRISKKMFGGIYTKAANVGAALVDKVERNISEDDPRNPAAIADNVGDIALMGSDLFGSYVESSCVALVVASISSFGINHDFTAMLYPLLVSSVGIRVYLITTLFATDFYEINAVKEIEPALKKQLIISTIFMTVGIAVISWIALGLRKSNAYSPVQDVADSCRTGVATNVIFGLALGYKSVSTPIFAIAISIFVSFSLASMYGIAVAARGMLSTIVTGLAIDAYGPISDNTGETLSGVLDGFLVFGVQIAISASNTGGAWDNAKKYIEAGACERDRSLGPKGFDPLKVNVIGDTIGGLSLNLLIKLMAVKSLVFALIGTNLLYHDLEDKVIFNADGNTSHANFRTQNMYDG